ncbi:MAG: histidine kinase [Eubacteriales bacterium]|nr:histidine kinase [Eubacteriales bacterium]
MKINRHAVGSNKRGLTSGKQIKHALMIFVIPFILFLVSYNVYALRSINRSLAETGNNLIYIYKNQMENEINSMQKSIVDIMANDSDFQSLVYARTLYEKYGCMQNMIGKFRRMFATNTGVSGCIILDAESELIREAYVDNGSYSYSDKESFKTILREHAENEELIREGWKICEVNGRSYLARVFFRSNVYIMGLYDLERTQIPQNVPGSDEDAFLFFADINMNPITSRDEADGSGISLKEAKAGDYYFSGSRMRYLIVQEKMENLPVWIIYAVPNYGIFMSSDRMPLLFMLITVVLVFLLWISFRMLEEKYLKPFQKLIETMNVICNGDLEAKMNEDHQILEFNTMSQAFNKMMEEIRTLKIASYEYKIETQQAMLQYLQIQIRPHFFLNCLKNLYGLAEEGKSREIQQTILVLSEHLRFIMRDDFQLVPLETELESVKNFCLLSLLTSSYSVSCQIQIEERLKKFEIPPISILTFVENAIKHGSRTDRPLKMQIRVSSLSGDGERYLSILIMDNGPGFTEKSLKELNGKGKGSYDGKHVGVQNVKHRFSLIYGDRATFLFSNMTGSGACVQILVPIEEEKDRKENAGDECADH